MAKSLRSKIKKRFRTLKRKQIEEVKGIKDKQDLNQNLQATIRGLNYRRKRYFLFYKMVNFFYFLAPEKKIKRILRKNP